MSALRSLGASLRKRRLSPRSFRAVSKVAGCRWVRQYLPVFSETYLPHGQFPVRRSSHAVPFVPVSCRPMVSSQMDLGEKGLGPLGGFHLAFAMLQLDNARPCGGSRGLERFAPAEREGASSSWHPHAHYSLLLEAVQSAAQAVVERSPPGEPAPSTPLLQKENPAGESGVSSKGQLGGIGGDLGKPSFKL